MNAYVLVDLIVVVFVLVDLKLFALETASLSL